MTEPTRPIIREEITEHRRKLLGVMSFENALQLVIIAIGAIVWGNNLRADLRVTNANLDHTQQEVAELKHTSSENHDALLDMKGDVRVIRQAIEQYQEKGKR